MHPAGVPGEPKSLKTSAMETAAAMVETFKPLKQICTHLCAFHVRSVVLSTDRSLGALCEQASPSMSHRCLSP